MKFKNLTRLSLVVLMAGLISFGPAVMAVDIVFVKPSTMLATGWALQTGTVSGLVTSSGLFDPAPGLPPGDGSFAFTTGPNGDSFAQQRNTKYQDVLLSSITAMSYDTYVTTHHDCVAPYISLVVDLNDNHVFDPGVDDKLFFEPCYQTGTYGTILPGGGQGILPQNLPIGPDGSTVRTGEWQHWDAFIGGWWSENDLGGGPPLTTLTNYINRDSAHQNAKIVNSADCLGGVRLTVGAGAPTWNDFIGNVDNLTIVNGLTNRTYDFAFEALPLPECLLPPEGGGCTVTIGFWKTHAGFSGHNSDLITPHLPLLLGTFGGAKTITVTTATQAVSLLSFQGSNGVFDASNGINKLYAQLLAAKLSIANGADGSAVASTIAAADAFLATHNSTDWAGLSKSQKKAVLGWMTTLDNYNNGVIGPGHCEQ